MTQVPISIKAFGNVLDYELDLDPERPGERNILGWLQKNRQLYEPDVSWVMLRLLREGDVFADVGGHIGYFTTLGAALVGPGGRVVALEPDPENRRRLEANVARNGFANVVVLDRPASADGRPASFFTNRDNDGGHALWDPATYEGNDASASAPAMEMRETVTLAAALAEADAATPKLIKVDTEGAEPFVLQGAGDLLGPDGIPFVIAELHEFGLKQLGSSQQALREMMAERGYATFLLPMRPGLPKMVPPGVEIRCPYIVNLLFADPSRICEYWQWVDLKTPNDVS